MDLSKLTAAAAGHHGLVTKSVATTNGMSTATWFRAVKDGRLILVHRGVARVAAFPRTPEQTIAAAVLATAPKSMASHRSAARLWGIPRPDTDPIEVIVAHRGRSPEVEGVVVHRPRDMGDLTPVQRSGIRTTNVLRLLCDLGAVDEAAVSAAVGHVVRPAWPRRSPCAGRSTGTRVAVATACRRSGPPSRSG